MERRMASACCRLAGSRGDPGVVFATLRLSVMRSIDGGGFRERAGGRFLDGERVIELYESLVGNYAYARHILVSVQRVFPGGALGGSSAASRDERASLRAVLWLRRPASSRRK